MISGPGSNFWKMAYQSCMRRLYFCVWSRKDMYYKLLVIYGTPCVVKRFVKWSLIILYVWGAIRVMCHKTGVWVTSNWQWRIFKLLVVLVKTVVKITQWQRENVIYQLPVKFLYHTDCIVFRALWFKKIFLFSSLEWQFKIDMQYRCMMSTSHWADESNDCFSSQNKLASGFNLNALIVFCWLKRLVENSVLLVYVVVAYKPSLSMVGKKTECRYDPEPCGPTCYLTQLVSVPFCCFSHCSGIFRTAFSQKSHPPHIWLSLKIGSKLTCVIFHIIVDYESFYLLDIVEWLQFLKPVSYTHLTLPTKRIV